MNIDNSIYLIPIVILREDDNKKFQRLDTKEIINSDEFEVLKEEPVFYMRLKIEDIPWQQDGYESKMYCHRFSRDLSKKPKIANAILLSDRKFVKDNFGIYLGQYCHIK